MGLYICADYIAALIRFADKLGIPTSELLHAPTMPSVLAGLVPWAAMEPLIISLERTPTPDRTALAFGLGLDISQHGLLGYAAKSARSGLEALLLDEQYIATRTNIVNFRVMVEQQELTVMMDMALRPDSPGWRFTHLVILGTMCRMYRDIYSDQSLNATFTVPFPVPSKEVTSLPGLNGVVWKEEPGAFRMSGPLSLLLVTLSTGDDTLRRLLVEQCQAALPDADLPEDIVAAVRGLLRNQLVDPPSVGSVGKQLSMTERTLKRYLQQAGTSYRTILTELRLEFAQYYLQTTSLTVDEIAFRLGYSSPSTFKSRFKQWSGRTPGQARQK